MVKASNAHGPLPNGHQNCSTMMPQARVTCETVERTIGFRSPIIACFDTVCDQVWICEWYLKILHTSGNEVPSNTAVLLLGPLDPSYRNHGTFPVCLIGQTVAFVISTGLRPSALCLLICWTCRTFFFYSQFQTMSNSWKYIQSWEIIKVCHTLT